MSKIISVDN